LLVVPAELVAVQVYVFPVVVVSELTVTDPQPDVLLIRLPLTVQVKPTLLMYQGLVPCVPLSVYVITGLVVRSANAGCVKHAPAPRHSIDAIKNFFMLLPFHCPAASLLTREITFAPRPRRCLARTQDQLKAGPIVGVQP
jgi:hypothetical protein